MDKQSMQSDARHADIIRSLVGALQGAIDDATAAGLDVTVNTDQGLECDVIGEGVQKRSQRMLVVDIKRHL